MFPPNVSAVLSPNKKRKGCAVKLKQVQIKNFRSIENATITFDPTFLVLAGINESGKTNILRAIRLLDPEGPMSATDRREVSPSEELGQKSWVRFVLEFDADEFEERLASLRTVVVSDLATPLLNSRAGAVFTLREVVLKQGCLYQVEVGGMRWGSYWARPSDMHVAPGWWKPKKGVPDDVELSVAAKSGAALRLNQAKLIHETALPPDALIHVESASADDVWAVAATGLVKYVVDNLPPVIFWEHSDEYLLPDELPLSEFASDPNKCLPLRHMFALAGCDDIRAAIETASASPGAIRRLLDRVSDLATKHLHARWKELELIKLELRHNGSNVNCFVQDKHNVYEMSRRSDGFKRFVTFLLMISARVAKDELVDAVFLQDEPDSSLHPSGVRYLRDEFIKIAEKNVVVCSTHSIFMVDGKKLDRHLLVSKKDEKTQVKVAAGENFREEEVIYNALGFSAFDAIPEENVIFEGWGDRVMFMKAKASTAKALKKRVERLGVTSVRGVTDFAKFAPLLDLARRKWLVVSDGDAAARSKQKEYNKVRYSGPWLRYDELLQVDQEITCEDFLVEKYFERVVLRVLGEQSPPLSLVGWSASATPRLAALKTPLEAATADKSKADALMKEIKATLTKELSPDDISPTYQKVIEAMVEKLKEQDE